MENKSCCVLSCYSNNTQNVSVPIILTILTKNGTTGASVQQPVLQTVRQFGFQIIITGRAEVQLFGKITTRCLCLICDLVMYFLSKIAVLKRLSL